VGIDIPARALTEEVLQGAATILLPEPMDHVIASSSKITTLTKEAFRAVPGAMMDNNEEVEQVTTNHLLREGEAALQHAPTIAKPSTSEMREIHKMSINNNNNSSEPWTFSDLQMRNAAGGKTIILQTVETASAEPHHSTIAIPTPEMYSHVTLDLRSPETSRQSTTIPSTTALLAEVAVAEDVLTEMTAFHQEGEDEASITARTVGWAHRLITAPSMHGIERLHRCASRTTSHARHQSTSTGRGREMTDQILSTHSHRTVPLHGTISHPRATIDPPLARRRLLQRLLRLPSTRERHYPTMAMLGPDQIGQLGTSLTSVVF